MLGRCIVLAFKLASSHSILGASAYGYQIAAHNIQSLGAFTAVEA